MNVRQALEKMRAHGYSAIPMINSEGEYLGTVCLGLLCKRRCKVTDFVSVIH